MTITIVVTSGDLEPRPRITFDAPRIVIGRGNGADLRLPDPTVSQRHATLRQRGHSYLLVDEGSTNGTAVGPVRLAAHSPRVLKDGDCIRLGRIELQIEIDPTAPPNHTPASAAALARDLVAAALTASGQRFEIPVEVTEGPLTGRRLVVNGNGEEHVVGRAETCDCFLDDPDCSRRHLSLVVDGGTLHVLDLGSKNGSRLGGEQLPSGERRAWPAGIPLHLGSSTLVYSDPIAHLLSHLEQTPDERLADEPPKRAAEKSPSPDRASTPPPVGGPTRDRQAPRPSWMVDALVGLFAVLVLGLSLLGLYWLMRSF